MRAIGLSILAFVAVSACTTPGGPYPSLQPRPGESVDPRLPVDRPMNDRPVTPALAGQLAQLLAQARDGDAAFGPKMAEAERLAAGAGSPQSEGWVAAQEALSAAIAATGPTRVALSDIDNIGAEALQAHGGISPNDLAAIKSAGAEVAAIDERQAERISAVQRRLGL
jgi:hypothetical protein